jgi:hypothetical protein
VPADALLRINLSVTLRQNTTPVVPGQPSRTRDSPHEKGRSAGRCGLSETLFRRRPSSYGRRHWTSRPPMRSWTIPG